MHTLNLHSFNEWDLNSDPRVRILYHILYGFKCLSTGIVWIWSLTDFDGDFVPPFKQMYYLK